MKSFSFLLVGFLVFVFLHSSNLFKHSLKWTILELMGLR